VTSSVDGNLLLVAGLRWRDTAKLALVARDAGLKVHLHGPRGHPLLELDWVRQAGVYSTFQPVRSITKALNEAEYGLVMPTDDQAAAALFEAYWAGGLNERGMATLRRSLGDPSTFKIRHDRSALSEIALEAGLPAPRSWAVHDVKTLDAALEQTGFPAVLKSDGSFGGDGVAVVDQGSSVHDVYSELGGLPRLKSAVGWLVYDREADYLRRLLSRRRRAVSVQEFVEGEPATLSAAAWEGKLLGATAFRVVRTRYATGPAVVLEPINHPDIERAAEVVAARLGLSGAFGLDFILSRGGARAELLELNPRPAPTFHLFLPSLAQPLMNMLAERVGVVAPALHPAIPATRIALFPHALDQEDELGELEGVYVDVPQDHGVANLCRPVPRQGPTAEALR
jgi:glutathione synthase/RimK-type ligase-like ATP-grasp enzyme